MKGKEGHSPPRKTQKNVSKRTAPTVDILCVSGGEKERNR